MTNPYHKETQAKSWHAWNEGHKQATATNQPGAVADERAEREAFDKIHVRGSGPPHFTTWSKWNEIEKKAAWEAWLARAALSQSAAGQSIGSNERFAAAERAAYAKGWTEALAAAERDKNRQSVGGGEEAAWQSRTYYEDGTHDEPRWGAWHECAKPDEATLKREKTLGIRREYRPLYLYASQRANSTVTREFTNELGNAIRITIEGPTSTSENILTPMEVEHLRAALSQSAAGQSVGGGAVPIASGETVELKNTLQCICGCEWESGQFGWELVSGPYTPQPQRQSAAVVDRMKPATGEDRKVYKAIADNYFKSAAVGEAVTDSHSRAWFSCVAALNQVAPGWIKNGKSALESAHEAILALAAPAQEGEKP